MVVLGVSQFEYMVLKFFVVRFIVSVVNIMLILIFFI